MSIFLLLRFLDRFPCCLLFFLYLAQLSVSTHLSFVSCDFVSLYPVSVRSFWLKTDSLVDVAGLLLEGTLHKHFAFLSDQSSSKSHPKSSSRSHSKTRKHCVKVKVCFQFRRVNQSNTTIMSWLSTALFLRRKLDRGTCAKERKGKMAP